MKLLFLTFAAGLLVPLKCGDDHTEPNDTEVSTPDSPQKIVMKRRPAMGFCLKSGEILDATIVMAENGDYRISGTVWEGASYPIINECDEELNETGDPVWHCSSEVEFGPRTLNDDQVDELIALSDAMVEPECRVSPACDPCLLIDIVVDDETYPSCVCGSPKPENYHDLFYDLADFLDDLAGQ